MNINGVNPWAAVTQSGYDVVTASQIQSLFAVEQNLKMITPGLKAKSVILVRPLESEFDNQRQECDLLYYCYRS